MKKLGLIICAFGAIMIINFLVNNITGFMIIDNNYTCPSGVNLTYYYSPQCSHCLKTRPLIDNLINNGCNIIKINVEEDFELALANGINNIPTLVYGEEQIIGEFNLDQVKELINN